MKSRISPCFAGKPVGRDTDLEKIERLVVAWAAGTVVSALGHLIDQLLIIFLAAGISGTFSHHTRTSVGFAVMVHRVRVHRDEALYDPRELDELRTAILESISQQGKLDAVLTQAIEAEDSKARRHRGCAGSRSGRPRHE
jgi:hypothetical protein